MRFFPLGASPSIVSPQPQGPLWVHESPGDCLSQRKPEKPEHPEGCVLGSYCCRSCSSTSADTWEPGAELVQGRKCFQHKRCGLCQEEREGRSLSSTGSPSVGDAAVTVDLSAQCSRPRERRHAHVRTHKHAPGGVAPNLKPRAFWVPASFLRSPALRSKETPPLLLQGQLHLPPQDE